MWVGDQPRISRLARIDAQHPSEKTSLCWTSANGCDDFCAAGTNRLDRRRVRVGAIGLSAKLQAPI